MPKSLSDGLKVELAKSYPNSTIEIAEKAVGLQKYNNCGLEVIENLIAAIAGEEARIEQEKVLAAHSVLYEQHLIEEAMQEGWQESVPGTREKDNKSTENPEAMGAAGEAIMDEVWQEARDSTTEEMVAETLEEVQLAKEALMSMNAVWKDTQSQVQAQDDSTRSIPTLSTKANEGRKKSPTEQLKQSEIENDQVDARYEAEKILMEEKIRAEQQEAAVPQPQQYPIRLAAVTISPNEIASSFNSLIKMFSGESPCGGDIPTNTGWSSGTLELLQGVRLVPTDSMGGPIRDSRDFMEAIESEWKALTAALPNKPVSPQLPSSSLLEGMKLMGGGSQESWAQQFKDEVDLSGKGE